MKKQIPNILTLGNLVCGGIAITLIFEDQMHWAGLLVIAAAVLDFLDGFVARVLKVAGPIGKQLDSLADMVTFGVVPALIAYKLIEAGVAHHHPDGVDGVAAYVKYAAFLIAAMSAYRLAKFNVDESQSDSFSGIPTPANAIFWIGIPLAMHYQTDSIPSQVSNWLANPHIVLVVSIVMSVLLVAPIRMIALKFKHYGFKGNVARYLLIIGCAFLLITFRFIGFPLIIALYVLLSIANGLTNKNDEVHS